MVIHDAAAATIVVCYGCFMADASVKVGETYNPHIYNWILRRLNRLLVSLLICEQRNVSFAAPCYQLMSITPSKMPVFDQSQSSSQ